MTRYTHYAVVAAALLLTGACGTENVSEPTAEETVWNVPKSDEDACDIITTAYATEQEAVAAAEGGAG